MDDFCWLTGPEAAKWLADTAAESRQPGTSAVRLASRLRGQLSAERTRLVLEQVELRRRGGEKFARADSMFFTPVGLEQSTDEVVAAYKTGRLHQMRVADLCCGIGGDALALAKRGPMIAIDRDPIASRFTEANLRAHGLEVAKEDATMRSVEVRIAEIAMESANALQLQNFGAWHIDPDRRPEGRRTTKVDWQEPGVEVLETLLAANSKAGIKLAPGAELPERWEQDAELEWISRGRQCRQLVAWFGDLAKSPGQRRATVLAGNPGETLRVATSWVGVPIECPIAERIRDFIYEPDAAVLAAKLEGVLATRWDLQAIAAGCAYLTGKHAHSVPGDFSSFEVLETMPYDVKRLKAWLKQRDIGRLEVKKRGVPLDPAHVRRDLRNDGHESATIFLARVSGQVTAIVARRISVETSQGSGVGAEGVPPVSPDG
jgi:hypothetical protein